MGATPNTELLQKSLRNPGRLVINPTTRSGGYPWGGTGLGLVRTVEVEFDGRYTEIRDPASGVVVEVRRKVVETPRIAVVLEGPTWDEDALAAVFSRAPTVNRVLPAETRPQGTLTPNVVSAWHPILFVPHDKYGKCVYFRRPAPLLSFRRSVEFSMARNAGLPLVFIPTPDQNYQTTPYWQICRIGNLQL